MQCSDHPISFYLNIRVTSKQESLTNHGGRNPAEIVRTHKEYSMRIYGRFKNTIHCDVSAILIRHQVIKLRWA